MTVLQVQCLFENFHQSDGWQRISRKGHKPYRLKIEKGHNITHIPGSITWIEQNSLHPQKKNRISFRINFLFLYSHSTKSKTKIKTNNSQVKKKKLIYRGLRFYILRKTNTYFFRLKCFHPSIVTLFNVLCPDIWDGSRTIMTTRYVLYAKLLRLNSPPFLFFSLFLYLSLNSYIILIFCLPPDPTPLSLSLSLPLPPFPPPPRSPYAIFLSISL